MEMDNNQPLSETLTDPEITRSLPGSPATRRCLNCLTPLTDIYCPHCGQKDLERRQTLGDLFINFISSFWSFESKFLNTGRVILFKPGMLAKEYNSGKRERYYHPARMYVFISFVYFLLFTTLPDDANEASDKSKSSTDNEFVSGNLDSLETRYQSLAQYDSAQNALPEEKKGNWLTAYVQKKQIQIREKYKGNGNEFQQSFMDSFIGNTSKVFFFLLPVFALILKLLYIRRDFYYSEHLIFTVFYRYT